MCYFAGCLLSLFTLCLIQMVSCAYTDFYQLETDTLTNYSKNLSPVLDDKTLSVTIGLILNSIKDYDDVAGVMTTVGELHIEWIDEKFTWNTRDYNNAEQLIMPLSEIWFPYLFVLNSVSNFNLDFDTYTTRAKIKYSGEVKLTIGQVFKTSCTPDVTHYPMDEHICEIVLSSLTEERLIRSSVSFDSSKMKTNPQWKILSETSMTEVLRDYNTHTWRFTLQRRPKFLAICVVFPVLFLGIINLFVFIIPPETGERVSFSVTVLLSHAVFLTIATDKLPDSGNSIPVFCMYLAAMLIYSGAIMLANISILVIFYKESIEDNVIRSSLCLPLSRKCRSSRVAGCVPDGSARNEVDEDASSVSDVKHNDSKGKSLCKRADIVCLTLFTFILVLEIVIFILYIDG